MWLDGTKTIINNPEIDKKHYIDKKTYQNFIAEKENINVQYPFMDVSRGSGISGLSVAAFLSKYGKKVLVLEQHYVAGGCCHTFKDGGYEFDTGIHYIGNIEKRRIY